MGEIEVYDKDLLADLMYARAAYMEQLEHIRFQFGQKMTGIVKQMEKLVEGDQECH